ncbi:hypothetical protein HETIRDRAFT_36236 [Heterobasidion irregulare TC 32-1]|uniref:Small ribosomal subunit protein mS29 n=1 Tax=Heterobasidion irregulare (strain TC 32-1) TaxID=747525 RepID=W4K0A5_HETIT|nr:uncharacterized protein HETIRDRAFT_36236 [Heterobasidion irregulare TC 32-1]ETW79159.1 hypothetical protein HETIRDRAFT_36236 [Heterobasidion irregulare TC 32-1]
MPMPVGQLQNPIFRDQRVEELNLATFYPAALTEHNLGQAMVLPMPENAPARVFGVPRNILVEYRMLTKPVTVVRDVSLIVADKLQAASQESSEKHRMVFTGMKGNGKSSLLLQAVEFARSNRWIIMYIPRAVDLVNSTTHYTYDLRTQTYLQPVFAYQTLQRFKTVNLSALQSLTTEKVIEVENRSPVPVGTKLADLADIGLNDQAVAPTVLSALMEALGAQTQYPVLLAIDDFQALFTNTTYRDPHFAMLKSWHLSMPRLLMEYAGGEKTFARGAVLGALSSTNTAFKLNAQLGHALKLQPWKKPSPYLKIPPEILRYTKGIERLRVPDRLQVNEAASIFEVWSKTKALHTHADDGLFMAKYTEASGNARDFVWKGLLATLET